MRITPATIHNMVQGAHRLLPSSEPGLSGRTGFRSSGCWNWRELERGVWLLWWRVGCNYIIYKYQIIELLTKKSHYQSLICMYKIVWSGYDSEKKHGQRKWRESNNGMVVIRKGKARLVMVFILFFGFFFILFFFFVVAEKLRNNANFLLWS